MTQGLYNLQQEILKYFCGQDVDGEILSELAQKDLSIYKSLIINSEEDLMSKTFPLTYKILEDNWRAIVWNYYEDHPSQSPIFNRLSKDFSSFLASDKFLSQYPNYPNYLAELNLYENTEIQIYNKEDQAPSSSVCPVLQILEFKFPISQIKLYLEKTQDDIQEIRNLDMEEEPELICMFRPQESTSVEIKIINANTRFVIEELQLGTAFDECFEKLAQTLQVISGPDSRNLFDNLIQELKKIKLLLD